MHSAPATPWTIDSLAREVTLSRATLTRRFTSLVGEAPLSYLTRWRMDLAAGQLRDTDDAVSAIAHRVGYTSEFAFSRAFSRVRGQPPGRYRSQVRGGPATVIRELRRRSSLRQAIRPSRRTWPLTLLSGRRKMAFTIRLATEADIPELVALMTDFYAESDFPLSAIAATPRSTFCLPPRRSVSCGSRRRAAFRSATLCSPSVSAWSMADLAVLLTTFMFDRQPAGGVPVRRCSLRHGTARGHAIFGSSRWRPDKPRSRRVPLRARRLRRQWTRAADASSAEPAARPLGLEAGDSCIYDGNLIARM